MRILIAAAGSRGDVAPLAGLGTVLRGAGHDVTVAAFGMLEELVTGCGLGFHLVPGDPQLLQASQQGQRWQERGTSPVSAIRFTRLAATVAVARRQTEVRMVIQVGWAPAETTDCGSVPTSSSAWSAERASCRAAG